MAPFAGNTGNTNKVISGSRERYSSTRTEVEDKIRRWSGMATPEEEGVKDDDRKRKKRNKKKQKKIEKLLPEYEKLASLGQAEALEIVAKLKQAQSDLAESKDVDLGAIIGRENDDTESDDDGEEDAAEAPRVTETRSESRPPRREARRDSPKKERHEIICDECGKKEFIHFKPNPDKPIYCKDCLEKRRARSKDRPAGGGSRKPRSGGMPSPRKAPEPIIVQVDDQPLDLGEIKSHTVSLKSGASPKKKPAA
jgi:CxxC-x17-CxxC domain-containing protein